MQVIFDAETVKYPWYFPPTLLSAIAIYFDADLALAGNIHVINALKTIEMDEVRARRAVLKDLAFSLQYSMTDTSVEDLERLGPDAVEIALAGMLQHSKWGKANLQQPYPMVQ
jgi:hypothetical protein